MNPHALQALLTGLLPLAAMTAGCGAFSNKEVGMIVVYEVDADKLPHGAEASDTNLKK